MYLSENILDGGFAGGALIAEQWVLTAGRNLFVGKNQSQTRRQEPLIPKVYLGIMCNVYRQEFNWLYTSPKESASL